MTVPAVETEKYNIALVPDMGTCEALWGYAAHWTQTANGYLIAPQGGGIPHITLSRFFTPKNSQEQAVACWQSVLGTLGNSFTVPITELAMALGKKPEEKNTLLWFNALPVASLIEAQRIAVDAVRGHNFEPSALDDVYQPHLTVAIVPEDELSKGIPSFRPLLRRDGYQMMLCVGRSGKNGMLESLLAPHDFARIMSDRQRQS